MAAKPKAVVIVAILAIAIAVVASVALYKYLKTQEEQVREAREAAVATEKVVVAAEEIPIGSVIEARNVKLADWPRANVPTGALKSAEAAAGRVALQTIMPGDVVAEGKLRPTEGPPGIMTYKIPEGHRAMTVAVDQVTGVAGFITPGSMVDVVLTTTIPDQKEPISKLIFQNIPVLATGQIIETKEGEPVLVPTVTLDVTPEDAEKLAMAASEGQLRLLLRRAGDTGMTMTEGATVRKVVTGAGGVAGARMAARGVKRPVAAGAPAKAMYGMVSVEVWRDGAKTVETFSSEKEAAK